MPRQNVPVYSFAGGEVSKSALGRLDIAEKLRLCAERMVNWIPLKRGAMTLRPGLGFILNTRSDAPARHLPFVAQTNDTAVIEITAGASRIIINDEVLTRGSVSTTITNGDFSASAGWTTVTTGGGVASISGGTLTLATPVFGSIATCSRQVTVAGADQGDEHGLRIVITRGPVKFRVGSTDGGQEYIAEETLGTGTHSLAFTPTGDFYVWFAVKSTAQRIVDSITIEAAGAVELPSAWVAADLPKLRHDQSGDVVSVWRDGVPQRQFERRLDGRSWSLVRYESLKGPFLNTGDKRVKLTFNKNLGNGTITASANFFTSDHVGTLIRAWHQTQESDTGGTDLAAEDEYTPGGVIRGNGSPQRDVFTRITGTWSGTLTSQSSIDGENWIKDQQLTNKEGWVKNFSTTVNDTGAGTTVTEPNDNTTVFVRIGFLPGDYTSGTAIISGSIDAASGYAGVVRITAVNSATSADYEVVRTIRSPRATKEWEEGLWGEVYGYPSAGTYFDGRLWQGGRLRLVGSAADDYNNHDPDLEGDGAPISRILDQGPADSVRWLLPLDRLIVGTDGVVLVIRSSNFDEPITPADMTAKKASTVGTADVQAVSIDEVGIWVARSGTRLWQLAPADTRSGYAGSELTLSNEDILAEGVVDMMVQRVPETRIHIVLNDGTAAVLVYEPEVETFAWCRVVTDGTIEGVVVIPGTSEDQVYYHVNRTINGQTKRYLEKWAEASQTLPGKVARLADSFKVWSDTGTTISGFDHLEGESVVVWGDSGPVMDTGDPASPALHTIASGVLTLPSVLRDGMAGLPYTGDWKSTKLAYAAGGGTPLNQRKRTSEYGLQLLSTHNRAIKIGGDTGSLQGMPRNILGKDVTANKVFGDQRLDETVFEQPMSSFKGDWHVDSRIHIRGRSPLPATIVGLTESQTTSG